ncbi:putative transmembrane protein [Gregarina niphandrodes]|uniref:Transmembrane protein n=1 Tax=Gregarina niphandrodes TaxID=110365 RepID=A0A023B235_GRENI|nr:putative transmembrane protein [Gregarina niphandrodes]EZG50496.1 putative transmembrane protein [Gregarina niphandrodes]|eukprot:XP_011132018.1 putative transmembrane protein [Gregarina niphandrodes]
MGNDKNAVQAATSWIGFVASCLTLLLGIFHVCNVKARIKWPSGSVIEDVQWSTWRAPLFTFTPDMFFDVWTPFFFGLLGCLAHLSQFSLVNRIAKDFIHYFVFLMIQGLFGNIGYDGGMGIIVSGFTFLAALFSLISFFMDQEAQASLNLNLGVDVRRPARA